MSHDGWSEVDSQSFRCHLTMREKGEGEEGGAVMRSLSNYIYSNNHLAILSICC